MNTAQVIQLPIVLRVEFDPDIRLGELLYRLGPEFVAKATLRGGVRIEKVARNVEETSDE